jgi:uncharacterized protein
MTARAVALDSLRALSGEELALHLREQRGQLFQVRLQQTIGQVENHRQIRAIRREIARTMTVQVEIRLAARSLGLPNWNKPSFACLSSRIPHGTPVTVQALRQIEAAEAAMKALGFTQVRVRHHGDVARIEVEPADIARLVEQRDQVVGLLREAGYKFVSVDLEGYATGSLNRVWKVGQ